MIDIDIEKNNQRISCIKNRDKQKKNNPGAAFKLCSKILEIQAFKKAKIVSSFISIKSEISMIHLNNFLKSSKKIIVLPVMMEKKNSLIFRKFDKNTIIKKNKYGILEPDDNSEILFPDFILIPCLAFDKYGFRLGYGGGYYDRTLSEFKKNNHPFISIAVAFDDQKVNQVIKNDYDQKIDYILTEKTIYNTV